MNVIAKTVTCTASASPGDPGAISTYRLQLGDPYIHRIVFAPVSHPSTAAYIYIKVYMPSGVIPARLPGSDEYITLCGDVVAVELNTLVQGPGWEVAIECYTTDNVDMLVTMIFETGREPATKVEVINFPEIVAP